MADEDSQEIHEPVIPAPVPDPEALSYDSGDVALSRMPIDWEMAKPEDWESKSPEEREAAFREQSRRIYYAIRSIAKALDKYVPQNDGASFSQEIDQVLDPEQVPHYEEPPEVTPGW